MISIPMEVALSIRIFDPEIEAHRQKRSEEVQKQNAKAITRSIIQGGPKLCVGPMEKVSCPDQRTISANKMMCQYCYAVHVAGFYGIVS